MKKIFFSLLLVFVYGFCTNVNAAGLGYFITTHDFEIGDFVDDEIYNENLEHVPIRDNIELYWYKVTFDDGINSENRGRITVAEKLMSEKIPSLTITISDTSVVSLNNGVLDVHKPGTVTITMTMSVKLTKEFQFDCPISKDTLNFDTNGGDKIDDKILESSSTVYPDLPIPKRNGYTFDGWYADKDLNTKIASLEKDYQNIDFKKKYDSHSCSDDSSATLYAKWIKNEVVENIPNTGLSDSKIILVIGSIMIVLGTLIIYPITYNEKSSKMN